VLVELARAFLVCYVEDEEHLFSHFLVFVQNTIRQMFKMFFAT
jgi:hypothetical protein